MDWIGWIGPTAVRGTTGTPPTHAFPLPCLPSPLSLPPSHPVCSYLMDQSYFPDGEARPPINPKGTLRWHFVKFKRQQELERQERERQQELERQEWERQQELERRERELERWRQWRSEEYRREEEAERLHRRWLAAQARALRRVPPPVGS